MLRVGRGKQDRYCGSLRCPEQSGSSAAGGIHYGPHVVHVGVQAWRLAAIDPIAQSGPTLVKQDQPRKCRKPVEEMAEARLFPMNIQIRDAAGYEDEVERS